MGNVEFTFNKEQLIELRNKLNRISPRDRSGVAYKAFVRGTAEVETHLKEDLSGETLFVRTGRLRNSIGSQVIEEKGELVGLVGSGVRTGKRVAYAGIHETGGTITPKRAKWLTIPTESARTKGGDTKGISARDFTNTFVRIFDNAHGAIYQRRGGTVTKLFSLVRRVDIPARQYLSRTVRECSVGVGQIMSDVISRELEKK